MQRYRSGHNGADSKSVCGQPHVGSNPTRSAIKAERTLVVRLVFIVELCGEELRQIACNLDMVRAPACFGTPPHYARTAGSESHPLRQIRPQFSRIAVLILHYKQFDKYEFVDEEIAWE